MPTPAKQFTHEKGGMVGMAEADNTKNTPVKESL